MRMPGVQLKLSRSLAMQQDNDPKHWSKSTTEWLRKNKILSFRGAKSPQPSGDAMESLKAVLLVCFNGVPAFTSFHLALQ